MAISQLESNTISRGIAAAQKILELEAALHRLNIDFDGLGNVKNTITQEELDSVASFSGLTTTELNDSMYRMTAIILPAIQDGYAVLSNLASRG